MQPSASFEYLREQIVGVDSTFTTPFGERLMVYCDYTASGRCLLFVENYLQSLQRTYANTHTEDDTTGRNMTQLLHEAEVSIKASVNAGPDGRIIAIGTGATGAINKLQQILGVYCPPATRARISDELDACIGEERRREFDRHLRAQQPVVFVGPFEHHSNEVSWREGFATVVEVRLDADGAIDLAHLEALLREPKYQSRVRIGSFSAASNVTGIRTPVHAIARLLHAHDAIACFDYAASAPYVQIDMNPQSADGDASIDAVFISPHKYLGGPGSSGILVFNKRLYDEQLRADGRRRRHRRLRQRGRSGLHRRHRRARKSRNARHAAGAESGARVARQRLDHQRAYRGARRRTAPARDVALAALPSIEILGNPDPARRIAIVSLNVKGPRRSLPASEIRHRVAERPVRHSVARRLLVRRTVRSSLAADRHRAIEPLSRSGSGKASAASSRAGVASASTIRWTTPRRTT